MDFWDGVAVGAFALGEGIGDGSGVARLTNSGANDDYPRWSPNGTKILFQSDRDHPDTG